MKSFMKDKSSKWYILAGLSIVLLTYIPFFQKGLFSCWDDSYHLYRIYSIADAMKNGIFPVKIHFIECYGYGYGTGLFYPNLLFYFPALLVMCGLSLTLAYKIFAFCLMVAVFGTTFYSSRKLCGNRDGAFIAATIVLLSSKMLNAFYVGMSLGIITGMIFMPLAIAGMHILVADEKFSYMIIVGFCGLLYSHTISTLLTVCICGAICLFHIKNVFKKRILIYLVYSVGIVSLLTAPYWLAMLEQMKSQLFKVKTPWTIAEQNVENIHTLTTRDGIGVLILAVLLVCIVGSIYFLIVKKNTAIIKESCISEFLFIAIVVGLLPLCYPFWHFMNSVAGIRIIQFPYRLWGPVSLLIAFVAGQIYSLATSQLGHERRIRNCLVILIVICGLVSGYRNFSSYYLKNDSTVVEQIINGEIAGLGGGEEWLPVMTTREYMQEPEVTRDNSGQPVNGKKEKGDSQFRFQADLSKEYYDVPYIYYKGYRAYLKNGDRVEIEQNQDTGMIRVMMPGTSGTAEVTVKYEMTKYQKISYIMLVVGIGVLLILIWEERRKVHD